MRIRRCLACTHRAFTPWQIAWAANAPLLCPRCQAPHRSNEGRLLGVLSALAMEIGMALGLLGGVVLLTPLLSWEWWVFALPASAMAGGFGAVLLLNLVRGLRLVAD